MDCDHIENCGFFRKFKSRTSIVWKSMVKQHCEGGDDCARRLMFNSGEIPSSDDLMPVGVHASKAFLSLP